MDLSKSSVLITGGSSGIGKALAKKFLDAGSRVLITGRDEIKLQRCASEFSGIETFKNDIGLAEERRKLATFIQWKMPKVNILINNAGIQRRVSLAEDQGTWGERQNEIDILLSAPIHLNDLLIPTILLHQNPSLIINVTSGGAYVPQVFAPVYSACKAALHSYTITLRHALKNTHCKVKELIPPAIQTGLVNENSAHGASLEMFIEDIFYKLLDENTCEVGYGATQGISQQIMGSPLSLIFETLSKRYPVKVYEHGGPNHMNYPE